MKEIPNQLLFQLLLTYISEVYFDITILFLGYVLVYIHSS